MTMVDVGPLADCDCFRIKNAAGQTVAWVGDEGCERHWTEPSPWPGVIEAASGWCAPAGTLVLDDTLRPELWPVGLTPEDLDWIARMLKLGEIDPEPLVGLLDMPTVTIGRGALDAFRWMSTEDVY